MVSSQFHYTKQNRFMPFLLAEILNFQGSTHRIGVGSFSKLILLNKQNLLIMLFPFSLWSEFHFPPVDHGIPCFSMTWISFFSCRSCSFRFSHDSMIQFSLRVSLSGIEKKKYYIAPHLTKSARECPACRDILKLIFWI